MTDGDLDTSSAWGAARHDGSALVTANRDPPISRPDNDRKVQSGQQVVELIAAHQKALRQVEGLVGRTPRMGTSGPAVPGFNPEATFAGCDDLIHR